MHRFGVGLGVLGEQGGEGFHAEFNMLSSTFRSIVQELDRLEMVVKQHRHTTLPLQISKVPSHAIESSSDQSSLPSRCSSSSLTYLSLLLFYL